MSDTPTDRLIRWAQAKGLTRDHMAHLYAAAIAQEYRKTDWEAVNAAIIERWSVSGLKYIKAKARR
jgi:hypothetical protein